MMRLEWLYEARCEFTELLEECRAKEGPQAARDMSRRVLDQVEGLAEAPRAGVLRRNTLLGRHGFRALLIGRCACIYRIEEDAVRVYHLTDAERGDLYQILGIVSPDTDREVRTMKNKVFLKSTLRQPVKTALLVLVTALITFAFVSRGAEYLLVKQETERLSGYYRAIGAVSAISGEQYVDAREAAAYLESNPLVKTVNTYNYVPAVMEGDICNVNTSAYRSYANTYFAFYGTLRDWDQKSFRFVADTVVEGYPEWVVEGREVFLYRTSGSLGNPQYPGATFNDWYLTTAKTGDPEDVDAAYGKLERGQRYLVMAYFNQQRVCRVAYDDKTEDYITYAIYSHPLADSFFYPVADGEADWSDPQLSEIRQHLACVRADHRSLNVVPLQDMSALPMTRDTRAGIYLTDGRWLNSQDSAQENRVCVVGNALASARGLKVGDNLTLTLQDAPSYFGIVEDTGWDLNRDSLKSVTDTYEIVGIYDYLDTFIHNERPNTDVQSFAYVPASALPEDFQLDYGSQMYYDYFYTPYSDFPMLFRGTASTLPYPGSVFFELEEPQAERQFLAEAEPALAELGFKPQMEESGWESFQGAAGPLRESSLYNVVIFSAVLLAALGMAAFVYFFSRRREMYIARALGLPASRAARQAASPLLAVSCPAILAGGGAGWQYAGRSGAALLSSLPSAGNVEASALLPLGYCALLCGIPLALMAALTAGGAVLLSRRPLLLGQTGAKGQSLAAQPGSEIRIAPAAVQSGTPVPTATADSLPAGKNVHSRESLNARFTLTFVWRHMVRAGGKSLLTMGLAAAFTVSLAMIQFSIVNNRKEVDQLYERTPVSLELVKADTTQTTTAGAFLFEETLETIVETGLIADSYVEGANYGSMFRYEETWQPGQGVSVRDQEQTKCAIRSIDSEEKFLSPFGSGQYAEIYYADGWDGSLFSTAWDTSSGEAFPIILPEEMWTKYELEGSELMGVASKGSFRMCAVAGYYTGDIGGASSGSRRSPYNESRPILMPTSALRTMVKRMLYSKAVFTVDPAQTRNTSELQAAIDELANAPRIGGVPVRIILWDEELRLAVEPLEASIRLMEILYPITLVLSLLTAAGIAVLFVMTSAREAAILRILGTTKLRSRAMLALQTAVTSLAGLLLGVAGVLAYAGRTRPELLAGLVSASVLCAVLYLLAAIAGAVLSAVSVTARNPLELLQVR
ncbi:MAG: hypothetical protein HFF81_11025, partial [Oscillospiraceae bacterium]|nr:hypothetical protein [Oscillospiraceae bacterium]